MGRYSKRYRLRRPKLEKHRTSRRPGDITQPAASCRVKTIGGLSGTQIQQIRMKSKRSLSADGPLDVREFPAAVARYRALWRCGTGNPGTIGRIDRASWVWGQYRSKPEQASGSCRRRYDWMRQPARLSIARVRQQATGQRGWTNMDEFLSWHSITIQY